MTYNLKLFLVLEKRKKKKKREAHKYKINKKVCFLWLTYMGLPTRKDNSLKDLQLNFLL